jgi:hypothetical protein
MKFGTPYLMGAGICVLGLLSRCWWGNAVDLAHVQLVALPFVAVVALNLRSEFVRIPATLILAAAIVGGSLGAVEAGVWTNELVAGGALTVARFEGDMLGANSRRFREQIDFHLKRQELPHSRRVAIEPEARPISKGQRKASRRIADVWPIVWGRERWLTMSLPVGKSVYLRSLASPAVKGLIPDLRLSGGVSSISMTVDWSGASAEFMALLTKGVVASTVGDPAGELSLAEAAKVQGRWTSSVHRALPLMLLAERHLMAAVKGSDLQRGYLECASQAIFSASHQGLYKNNPELFAALYNDIGVVLWLKWLSTGEDRLRSSAIAYWDRALRTPEASNQVRDAAHHHLLMVRRGGAAGPPRVSQRSRHAPGG